MKSIFVRTYTQYIFNANIGDGQSDAKAEDNKKERKAKKEKNYEEEFDDYVSEEIELFENKNFKRISTSESINDLEILQATLNKIGKYMYNKK